MNTDLPPTHPSPAPEIQPPPLPNRKRGPARSLWLFLILALTLLYIGPLRTEVSFTDENGRPPSSFEVTLRSGDREKKALVENGRLRFTRYLWKEIVVTDESCLKSTHEVTGRKMAVSIERNALGKLRGAATALPSVPQRGDPDPKDE